MKYEFEKLFTNRLFVLTLLVLLCVNCVMAYISAPDDKAWNNALAVFFEDYSASPDEYDKSYNEYKSARDTVTDKQIQAVLNGENPDKYVFTEPSTLYPESGFTDGEFYTALYKRGEYNASYRETIKNILAETEKNLSAVTDPFMRDYLNQVKSTYTPLTELQLSGNMVSGWEAFFGYKATAVFCMFVVFTAAFVIANVDREQRLEAILFSSKKGSRYIICQKLTVLAFVCALTVVLFELTALFAFALKTVFIGHREFLAALDAYRLCPYPVYIYEYAIIRVAVRFAALLMLGMLFVAVSRVIKNIFGVFIFGAGFIGINVLLNSIKQIVAGFSPLTVNIFKLSDADSIFLKYSCIDLFGNPIPTYAFYSVLFVIGISALVSVIFFTWRTSRVPNISKRFNINIPHYTPRTLLGFEIKKLFQQSAVGLPVLAIIISKILMCALNAGAALPYTEQLYRSYMQTLEGEYTEFTEQYITEEKARFSQIFETEAYLSVKYENGEVGYNEYYAAKLSAQAETKKYEAFCKAEAEVKRIAELNEQDISAYIVYDTGWEKLLFSTPDILFVLLLLVPTFAFFSDDKAGLCLISNTTVGGRRAAIIRKTVLCTAFVVFCSLAFSALDVFTANSLYGLSYSQSACVSLQALAETDSLFSIGGLTAVLVLYRVILSAIATLLAVSLSAFIRIPSVPPILFGCFLFLPWLLYVLVGGNLKYISFSHLYCLTSLTDIRALPLLILVLLAAMALYVKTLFDASKV